MMTLMILMILGCSMLQPSPPPRCVDVLRTLFDKTEGTDGMARRVRGEQRIQECMRQELFTTDVKDFPHTHRELQIRIIHLYNLTPEIMDDEIAEQMIHLSKKERLRELDKGRSIGFVWTFFASASAQTLYSYDKEYLPRLISELGVHRPRTYNELSRQCGESMYLFPEIYVCVIIGLDGISRQAYPLDLERDAQDEVKVNAFMETYLAKSEEIRKSQRALQRGDGTSGNQGGR